MLTAVVFGLAQGARHSLEPDHLAAVSVLIRDSRGARRSAWLGAVWGLGHTCSLMAMSLAVIGFGAALPAAADRVFAGAVAATLIVLGIRALRHDPRHAAVPRVRSPLQAFVVGSIHGLAGSSALPALVFAAIPTPSARLVAMTLFGAGSIAGMAAASAVAGAWLQRIERPWLLATLRIVIGLSSIAIGARTALAAAGLAG